MSLEIEKIEKEKKLKLSVEKQESIEDLEKSLEDEISVSVDNLKNQDVKVKEIEKSVGLNNNALIEEIKEEIHLNESLQKVNNEADAMKKSTLSELISEKSFWGNIESTEEKVQKVEELFKSLDTQELQREDIETHARGWNVTNNINQIERFKTSIIEHVSKKSTYGLGYVQNFETLISQKAFQDIIWLSSGIDPAVITSQYGNKKFNALIQERPEFLDSSEFKKIRLHLIKQGIKDGNIFEGYIHTKSEEFPKTKIDFFKKKEDDWAIPDLNIKDNSFEENNKNKVKRKTLRSENDDNIIDIYKYEYDISYIDSLSNKEREEAKDAFVEKISSNMYTRFSSEKVFADEIFKVGSKLGVSEDEINQYAYNAMIQGVSSGRPPANGIDKEFSIVYQKIQETLTEPEKRKEVLDSLQGNIKTKDGRFDGWKETLNYLNINNEEKESIINSYLDFSQGEQFPNKQRDIFGYKWESEENFAFSKEKRLIAFSTMSTDQKSRIITDYTGSLEKLNYLSFTNADILEFGVNNIESQNYISPSDIEKAKRIIQENFPNVTLDDKDIAKRSIFKNSSNIRDIEESLARNTIEMSPSEIVDQFSSPEDFILKQIKGADLYKLKTLETFKNNPNTPELPNLSTELYTEIKKHVLDQKNEYSGDKSNLKEILSFVPKQYKLSVLTDPDLQEAFSNYYTNALRKNDQRFINDLRFLISKTENLNNPEQKVFDEYVQEKDYSNLLAYYKTLQKSDVSSPSIQNIENLFKERIANYDVDSESIVLNSNTLEKTLKEISLQQLNQLTPENLANEELIQEWLNINYGSDSKVISRVFNLVKNSKDFSYFDKEIKNNLFKGNLSDKFIGTLQDVAENNPESIDRTVEFVKDMGQVFDNQFIEQNYDHLYKTLSTLDTKEYRVKIDLLQEIRPLLSSPLISGINFEKLFAEISSYDEQDRKKFFDLINTTTYRTDSENDLGWAKNTILYVNEVEEYGVLHRDQNKKDKMIDLFSGDYKNTALREMAGEWKDFLNSDANLLPPQIRLVSKIIDEAGGAGNMKHIESLGNLISQVQSTLDNKKTTDSTIQEMKSMLSILENRFSKEKWSQDEISEFYNLSKDILEAAPSLYTTLGPIFENISSPKDMKKFMSDIFPFYQTQLVIQQNISDENTTYDPRGLVEMRSSIKEFANKLEQDKNETDVFESEKLRLLEIAKDGFKNRFGLLKVPENFTKENLRSIQNTIRYMGNISRRTPERESLISLYLGLELDNKWGDFRGGKEINFGEYISEKQLQTISPLLEEKQKSYKLLSEVSGIGMDKMFKFQDLLQEDVSNNLIGDIQTIDVKLGNIKRNIDELVDPDIYQTQKEKNVLNIFSTEGKNVNAVLSKLYGISTGKNIQLSKEDNGIKSKIESIFSVNEWTPNRVKEIQDEIQPIGLVISMVNKMQEEKVEENIAELQTRLIPNGQIIEIFNKLGEEFHQESGALALSKDLSYLENIIVKDENKITAEEKVVVKDYINSVREKMKDMENVFDHVKQYFEKIKKSSHVENNSVLKSRISEIEKVIYSQDTSSVITSQMTKDLNLIIENMRQCLGCMRKEANNDTNLSFGDYNKFFMMNKSEKEKGSISDEIVFFVPITMPDGSKEMSFVMDQVYGSKSSDVLLGNISAVYKKYQVLKKEFPNARLSVSVTSSAMKSVGLDGDILEKRLRDIINKKVEVVKFEELNAFIPKSALSDNYVEFGKSFSARQSGERQYSGLVLK